MTDKHHDIVSLLRSMAYVSDMYDAVICSEAADEIERLRAALDEIHRHCGDNGEANGDRDRRWAAQIARAALSAGK